MASTAAAAAQESLTLTYDGHNSSVATEFGGAVAGVLCANFGFRFYMNAVIIGLTCVLGLIGNTTSILVLQKDQHNRVVVFLLQSLAVADNSVLCISFIVLTVFHGILTSVDLDTHDRLIPFVLKYVNPLGCMAQCATIWMTVLLAVNRYIAICRPFAAKRWLTLTSARVQVAVVLIVSVTLNMSRFFEVRIIYPDSDQNATNSSSSVVLPRPKRHERTALKSDDGYNLYYIGAFYASAILILPLLLLVGFNVPLIRQMQRAKRKMKQNSLSYSGRHEDNITIVMVTIILMLIICHAPDSITMILKWIPGRREHDCPHPLFITNNVSNLLVVTNSSANFIVYYILRRRFRRILCQRLFCYRSRIGSVNRNSFQSTDGYMVNSCSPTSANGSNCHLNAISIRERYRLTKKRDSNLTCLLAQNNARSGSVAGQLP